MGNAIDHPSIRKNLMAATIFPPRFGQPEEFAHMAICIIENQMLNASVIRLDGGSRVPKL
jgi:3-hydroxyacyl-CoA dehydrogenase/3-hydroxy-2-methylbutyryl-CoA dehydrogenase